MVRLTGKFSQLRPCKVLVAGDLMLDTYTIGKAKRISPEAPVAVLQVSHQEHRPGGSGNVVLNLVSLGVAVVAIGRVGDDPAGELLCQALAAEGVNTQGILKQLNYQTPIKNRIIAENQQIVRIDHEQITPIPEMLEQQIIDSLPQLLQDVQVVAISDYGKGLLSRSLLEAIIEMARSKKIPVISDPKGLDFTKYNGSTIIKPNLGEAIAAARLGPEASIENVAAKILQTVRAEVLMITRSEEGISTFTNDGARKDFPVCAQEVKDVTGAGDTVLATLACAIGSGLSISEAAQLSNVAAEIAIGHLGCARVSLSQLAQRLLQNDAVNKLFDEEHLFALQEALRGCHFVVLGVDSSHGLTSLLFKTIHQLAQSKDKQLLLYICDTNPNQEFIDILASLHNVNFIITHAESMRHLCDRIHPQEVYILEDNQCKKLSHTHALLK